MKVLLPTVIREETSRTARPQTCAQITCKATLYCLYTVGLFMLLTALSMAAMHTGTWVSSSLAIPTACPKCRAQEILECPECFPCPKPKCDACPPPVECPEAEIECPEPEECPTCPKCQKCGSMGLQEILECPECIECPKNNCAACPITVDCSKCQDAAVTAAGKKGDRQAAPDNAALTERQRQMAFCELVHPMQSPGIGPVRAEGVPGSPEVWVYKGNDIVSDSISKHHTWETHDIQQVLWAMRQPVPVAEAKDGVAALGQGSDLFVDVGANLAWFTVNIAAAGYKVAAFEGMRQNQQLIRSTLCSNPALSENITLYPVALGTSKASCFIFSGDNNLGDGVTDCKATSEAAALKAVPKGYTLRGSMQVERMDVAFPGQDIKSMKIDVEGYEIMVLRGAEGIFKKHIVWFLILEYSYPMTQGTLEGAHPKELPRYIAKQGFRISFNSFQGPFIDGTSEEQLEAIATVSKANKLNNLFCVNERYFKMQPPNKNTVFFKSAAEILQHAGVPAGFQ